METFFSGMILRGGERPAGCGRETSAGPARDPTLRTLPTDQFSTQKLLARSLLQIGRPHEARDTLQPMLEGGV